MGVKGYFGSLKNTKKSENRKDFDNLFIDGNQVLSQVDRKGKKKNLKKDLERVFKRIIDQFKPKKLLYIAFDGVAPMGKLVNRYK
jgi:5'-3' exonuclease